MWILDNGGEPLWREKEGQMCLLPGFGTGPTPTTQCYCCDLLLKPIPVHYKGGKVRGLPTGSARLPSHEEQAILSRWAGLWDIVTLPDESKPYGSTSYTRVNFSGGKRVMHGGPHQPRELLVALYSAPG